MSADLSTVLDFLLSLFQKGLGYSSINTARSALSTILFFEGKAVGEHPIVVRFLKGVFNKRPSLPRYSQIWDVNSVLEKLKDIYPASKLSFKQLTLKVVTLAALITGQRVQTLHMLQLENLNISDDGYGFIITQNVKTSRPGKHIEPIRFVKFKDDKRLCIVTYLKEYITRRNKLRDSSGPLFISYRKPHGFVSKNTISRWIRTELKYCGVDTKLFKAHSTRSASTSKVATFAPISVVLAAGNWSNKSTFTRYYHKQVKESFSTTLLNQAVSKGKGGGA